MKQVKLALILTLPFFIVSCEKDTFSIGEQIQLWNCHMDTWTETFNQTEAIKDALIGVWDWKHEYCPDERNPQSNCTYENLSLELKPNGTLAIIEDEEVIHVALWDVHTISFYVGGLSISPPSDIYPNLLAGRIIICRTKSSVSLMLDNSNEKEGYNCNQHFTKR